MNTSAISNMTAEELERHTEHLLNTADLGPVVAATLARWLNLLDDYEHTEGVERRMELIKKQVHDIVGSVEEIKSITGWPPR